MSDKLKKLVDDSSVKFPEWIETINDYNSMFSLGKKPSEGEGINLTYKASGVLGKISELWLKHGAFKDKFDNSQMYFNAYILQIYIKSEKTNNEFILGIDNRGIYLDTHMRYSQNLRKMDDSFYQDILALMDLGKFDIQEN
jgi:hypothetical protein